MHTLTIYQRQRLLAKVLQLHTSAAFCWEEEDRFDVLRHQKVVAKRTERAHGAMHASSNASATRHVSRFGRGGGCDTWMMQLPAREVGIVSKLTIRLLMISSTTAFFAESKEVFIHENFCNCRDHPCHDRKWGTCPWRWLPEELASGPMLPYGQLDRDFSLPLTTLD